MLQLHSSPPISTIRESRGDVQEGPMLLFMLLFSCDVGLMIKIWIVKEVACWSWRFLLFFSCRIQSGTTCHSTVDSSGCRMKAPGKALGGWSIQMVEKVARRPGDVLCRWTTATSTRRAEGGQLRKRQPCRLPRRRARTALLSSPSGQGVPPPAAVMSWMHGQIFAPVQIQMPVRSVAACHRSWRAPN